MAAGIFSNQQMVVQIVHQIHAKDTLAINTVEATLLKLRSRIVTPDQTGEGSNQGIEILPDDERILTPEEFRAGAIVLPEPWMVWHIIQHPDEIRNLSRRQFQEFSAALLERKGLKVTLGPVGADGGVDVRAERDGEFGPELILVQAKHPDPGNKVRLETIKLLHYQVVSEHATRGLVMTDSSFTRAALTQIKASRYQMEGADGDRIRQWLEALRTGASGAR